MHGRFGMMDTPTSLFRSVYSPMSLQSPFLFYFLMEYISTLDHSLLQMSVWLPTASHIVAPLIEEVSETSHAGANGKAGKKEEKRKKLS
jgi:hypothetical protein